MDLEGIKIGVLGGGVSKEREISLLSAQEAHKALQDANLDAVFIDIYTCLEEKVKELIKSYSIDLAFIALHGEFGEDGQIQAILEDLSIPYTGSGISSSLLAMDKVLAKNIFTKSSISTPDFIIYSDIKSIPENIKYPVVVKPNFCGSSLGISIVENKPALKQALRCACSYQGKVLLEEYIEGRELTVGILGQEPLAVVEIIPKKGHFDFEAKYNEGGSEFIVPARLENSIYKRVQKTAMAAHKALGLRDFSRVDLRLKPNFKPYVLEVNSIPGLTSHSLLPLSAKACGIGFKELILKMVEFALDEKKEIQKV